MDSAEIYAHFSIAVLEAITKFDQKESWYPDILHANDWHTGILPLFIQHVTSNGKFLEILPIFL